MKIVPKGVSAERFGKRMMKLAWDACGGPLGMGVLQDRGIQNEDQIWERIQGAGDYMINTRKSNEIYGDYVFGRMMKFGFKLQGDCLDIPSREWQWDYQGFSGEGPSKFKDLDALLAATIKSFQDENVEVALETQAV